MNRKKRPRPKHVAKAPRVSTIALTGAMVLAVGCCQRTTEGIDRGVSGSVYGDVIPVEVAVLSPEPFVERFDVAGDVQARELVTVAAETSGRVASVRAEIGDRVRRGRTLIELDRRSPQARLHKVEADLERARTELSFAERELERQQRLVSNSVAAERALDEAERNAETRRVDVAAQQAELEVAKVDLDRTTVTAPITGAVARRYISQGEYVTPGDPVLDIVSEELVFVLSVAERDVLALEPGLNLEVRVDAAPTTPLRGRVLAVSPSGNLQTRTFRVEILLDRADVSAQRILPGMSGRTTIIRRSYEAALLLPEAAVLRDGSTSFVYVLDRDLPSAVSDAEADRPGQGLASVRRAAVEILSQVGSRVVIAPTFPANTEFVVVGQAAVSEGAQVRVRRRLESLIERGFE